MTDTTSIRTAHGTMKIQHTGPGSGSIVSDFRQYRVEGSAFDAALDALESLVLAHACLDVAMVRDPNYVQGINVALDAILNQCGEE